jgi:transcriptional regulator GlxA family with amidase domain
MIDVVILFLRGGSASTATLPLEVFRNTGTLWNVINGQPLDPQFRVRTASIDGRPVRIDALLSMTPMMSFAEVKTPQLIFVPAGGCELDLLLRDGYDIETVIAKNAAVIPWLRRWAARGIQIAAACSGVALVAAAGLLDGRQATLHWGLADLYRRHFHAVDWRTEYLVTDAGGRYCGGGLNAASDLSLYLVEKFCGRGIAVQCAKAMLIEMPRLWQVAFTNFPITHGHDDAAVFRAQEWLHKHYADEVQLDRLAAEIGMSSRNFARRFKQATGHGPLAYLQSLRIEIAKRLIENDRQTVQEVAGEVGYEDLLFFRNLFKRHTGLSPNEYRRRFGQTARAVAAE